MDVCVEEAKRIFCRVPRSSLFRYYGTDGKMRETFSKGKHKSKAVNSIGFDPNLLLDLISPPSAQPRPSKGSLSSVSAQADLVCFLSFLLVLSI